MSSCSRRGDGSSYQLPGLDGAHNSCLHYDVSDVPPKPWRPIAKRGSTGCGGCGSCSPAIGESKTNRLLDERIVAIAPCEFERQPRIERWLREKTRSHTTMSLCSVHQEWMTQKYRSCCSRRVRLRHPFRCTRGCI